MISLGDLSNNASISEVLANMSVRHNSMQGILNSKLQNLQAVHDSWEDDSIKSAVEIMKSLRDNSVMVDMLRVINCKPRLISLEVATLLLPLLMELLFDIYEEYFLANLVIFLLRVTHCR